MTNCGEMKKLLPNSYVQERILIDLLEKRLQVGFFKNISPSTKHCIIVHIVFNNSRELHNNVWGYAHLEFYLFSDLGDIHIYLSKS